MSDSSKFERLEKTVRQFCRGRMLASMYNSKQSPSWNFGIKIINYNSNLFYFCDVLHFKIDRKWNFICQVRYFQFNFWIVIFHFHFFLFGIKWANVSFWCALCKQRLLMQAFALEGILSNEKMIYPKTSLSKESSGYSIT